MSDGRGEPFIRGEVVTVWPFPQGKSRAVVISSVTGENVRVRLDNGVRMTCLPHEVERDRARWSVMVAGELPEY